MIKNYFTIAWRSLWKNKAFALINILGLAIGMAAFLLIFFYVQYERSFDQFHAKKEQVYRVQQDRYDKGKLSTQWAASCAAIGPILKDNFPEVVEFVKLKSSNNSVMAHEDKVFREENVFYTAGSFFQLFSIPLLKGVDSLVLKRPYTAVISESTAKKYFGKESPIGKVLQQNGTRYFEITGVFQDIPQNSHIEANLLFSFETVVDLYGTDAHDDWWWDGFYTYVELKEQVDIPAFENTIDGFVQNQIKGTPEGVSQSMKFKLQALPDIHLTSNYMMEIKPNGDQTATNFLFLIALFILFIAWVNYINLATAKSVERSREVGVRKVLGSKRDQLIHQFLVEAFILNLIAVVLTVLLFFITIPYFNHLTGWNLTLEWVGIRFLLILLVLLIIGTLSSGLYPAFFLSKDRPITVLKGKSTSSNSGNFLRKGLVIFQFLASLTLMVGTYTVYQQLNFMNNQELGVNIDQTLVLRGPANSDSLYLDRFNGFKEKISSIPEISSITASNAIPGGPPKWNAGGIRLIDQEQSEGKQYRVIGTDENFVDAYDLTLLAGRNFSTERANDKNTVLLNEFATQVLGFDQIEEALEKEIQIWGNNYKIIGILKDYHQESLKHSIEQLIFSYRPKATDFYSLKIRDKNTATTLAKLEKEWTTTFPNTPFDFFFLDEHYNQQYQSDQQFGKVFSFFALLAIFIACLGLFGLSAYLTVQRTKEIGVRKILGASLSNIVFLLAKDFIRLILISILLAIPIAWLAMNNWLDNFAHRMSLNWWIFVLPSLVLLLIALMTISIQTIKAGLINPINAVKEE